MLVDDVCAALFADPPRWGPRERTDDHGKRVIQFNCPHADRHATVALATLAGDGWTCPSCHIAQSIETLAPLVGVPVSNGAESAEVAPVVRRTVTAADLVVELSAETTNDPTSPLSEQADFAEPDIDEAPFAIVTHPESFITRYVGHVSGRTDAPGAAHELMAVGILSALAGPQPRIRLATSPRGMPLTIWASYIVDSTVGRKSTVVNFGHDLLESTLGSFALINWEGSPQGLIQRLQDCDGKAAVFVRDEYSGLLSQMNRGGHMAGLAQTLIRAYDVAILENIRTRKRNKSTGNVEGDTDRVEMPYLVKLTATTWESFVTRATIDNVLDGFLARFVFVTGAALPRRVELEDATMREEFDELTRLAADYYKRAGWVRDIEPGEDVLEAAWKLEQEWTALAPDTVRPDAAGPALKRLADTVLKVSALLAIERADNARISISMADFVAARKMGERWLSCSLRVIDALGATKFRRDCEAVAKTVRARPNGIKLQDLYRRHRNLRKRDFDEILDALETQEVVRGLREEGARGRPAMTYYPNAQRT